MEKITLTQETIDTIKAYFDNPELAEGNTENYVPDAEFEQDNYTIYVSAWLYGHREVHDMVHSEVPPPNIETFSSYVLDSFEIEDVWGVDKDGEEVEITNKNAL